MDGTDEPSACVETLRCLEMIQRKKELQGSPANDNNDDDNIIHLDGDNFNHLTDNDLNHLDLNDTNYHRCDFNF